MFSRFLCWLCAAELDRLRMLWVADVVEKQRAAYLVGFAQGEMRGRSLMLEEIDGIVLARGGLSEVKQEDVDRLKKVGVH